MADSTPRPACTVHLTDETIPGDGVTVMEDRAGDAVWLVIDRARLLADPERVVTALGPHITAARQRRADEALALLRAAS